MRLLPLMIRRLLCRHEWEWEELPGYCNDGGVFRPLVVRRCRRCGKMERI